MKKLLSIFAIVAFLGACNCHKTKTSNVACSDQKESTAITVDSFLVIAGDYVGKEITVKGTVDHVCKHSGKRIKLVSASGQNYIIGIATEKVDTFKNDLEGSDICLTGMVVETKMDSICVTHCEAKESEIEHKECAEHALSVEQTKSNREEFQESGSSNAVVYSINVTSLHMCGSTSNEGCGQMKNTKAEPDKDCCGGNDKEANGVDKKALDEASKPCCEKK